MDRIRSGIIGTGFIGGVHAAAARAARRRRAGRGIRHP